jgi:DNA-binding transcriptional regulator YhcF (GntR family)
MKYSFSDEVRWVLAEAKREADALSHDYVGTEHILLALIGVKESLGGRVLSAMGVSAVAVRGRLMESVRKGKAGLSSGELPYTSRAKKVLEYSMTEAREMADSHVSSEHLLLGLMREERGIAGQVLFSLGATIDSARLAIERVRRGESAEVAPRRVAEAVSKSASDDAVWFLEIDSASSQAIYEQIISRIEEAVATGRLRAGERLPAVRELAGELGVAPGTVARAYGALERKGILETEGARGTRVGGRAEAANGEHDERLESMLRAVVVAAFHMGVSAQRVRDALERAMRDIFPDAKP